MISACAGECWRTRTQRCAGEALGSDGRGSAALEKIGWERQEKTNQGDNMTARIMELRKLVEENGGEVTPEQVVERARNPASALHGAFTWDDTEAAKNWRIEQARRLLRVSVIVMQHPDSGKEVNVRAFFSPSADQCEARSYQYTPIMLKTKGGRDSILRVALAEFNAFKSKYEFLEELVPLFVAAKTIRVIE